MWYHSSSALELQGIPSGLLPGKNVACRLLDNQSIISLVVEVTRFNWISLQVVEFIQVPVSQAKFPAFGGDYSAGRFIHCAFNRPARRELCPFHHLRSEEHTSELQSLAYLVCRLLLEKKKTSS